MIIQQTEKPYSWLQLPCEGPGFRPDGADIHLTIKFFGKTRIESSRIYHMVRDSNLLGYRWDMKDFEWQPAIFSDLAYVFEFAKYPAALVELHNLFSMVKDDFSPWRPHITMTKTQWDITREKRLTPLQRVRIGHQLQLFVSNEEIFADAIETESCCANEKRNMNGGCDSCGDPCI